MSNKPSLVELGRTKIEAFPLGFGGIPIQRVSEEEAVKVVKEAVNNGINFIDTARAYGDSEEKIGKALSELDEKVHIATKTLVSDKGDAIEKVEKSLEKLQVDKIDIYQLHAVNDDEDLEKRMREGGALEGLKQKQEEDEIEHIGISGHRNETLVKALETGEFDTVMFCYNFIENECEEDLIKSADDRNVGMLGMKPLAGGRLDAPEVALKYVLRQEGVLPIPGMETKEEVQENIKIAKGSWKLTSEDEKIQKELEEKLGTQFCRRCGYCKPCPQDILIPTVLRAQSFINRMTSDSIREGWIGEAFEKAENCTECRECVEKCPYNLPIPELIEENKRTMSQYLNSTTSPSAPS